ncbi:hypothetical protein Y032_0035g3041 [Ancylostoma ceylanicum]|uniref:Uncharacterized protein n=1 Tax=Ancylostoma ceylanicum TaxID=53326 RepID=A0A016UN40_9BILA|nr:hypothetical protein Y032_0035g3041 [Ancylostoma ceylanicum]
MPPPSSNASLSRCSEKRQELTADQVFLLYRKGVTEQRKGNFSLALHCLQPLIPFFCNTPLIWVRIIEIGIRLLYYRVELLFPYLCYKFIAFLFQDNVNEGKILEIYGSGRTRRVVLAPKGHSNGARPSAAFYAQIADQAGITEDYLESIAGVLLSLTHKTKNRQLRITSLSLAAYVALKMGRYHYAADLAHKMIDEEESMGNCSMTASMYLGIRPGVEVASHIRSRADPFQPFKSFVERLSASGCWQGWNGSARARICATCTSGRMPSIAPGGALDS